MNHETIEAISKLWALALIVCPTILALVFSKQLKAFLSSVTLTKLHLKRGDTEFQTEFALKQKSEATSISEPNKSESQSIADLPPPKIDEGVLSSSAMLLVMETEVEAGGTAPGSHRQWFSDIDDAISSRNFDEADKYFNRHQETVSDAAEKLQNEAVYLYYKSRAGDTSAFEKLKELARRESLGAQGFYLVGEIYRAIAL